MARLRANPICWFGSGELAEPGVRPDEIDIVVSRRQAEVVSQESPAGETRAANWMGSQ